MTINVSQPAPSDQFTKDDHENHKIVVINGVVTNENTQFGVQPVCRGDIICADCLRAWGGEAIFGKFIAPRFGGAPVTAGILYRGKAKGPNNPPWLVEDLNEDEMADVQALVNRVVRKLPNGKLAIDWDAFSFDANDKKDL